VLESPVIQVNHEKAALAKTRAVDCSLQFQSREPRKLHGHFREATIEQTAWFASFAGAMTSEPGAVVLRAWQEGGSGLSSI
jgi:hypothetical protein